MRVQVSTISGSSRLLAVQKGALVLTREPGHCLKRLDETPKSPRAGAQNLAQYLEGEDVEGDGRQGRESTSEGS